MTLLGRLMTVAAIVAAVPPCADAADRRFPDWPCVQARVAEISVAAAWTGPPIEDALDNWHADREVADLVARVAARRMPLAEAEKASIEFVQNREGDKQHKAKLLVAGLFDTLNRERLDVVNGLERLTRRQRDFAASIEADAARLRDLQAKPDADSKEVADLANRVQWATRIFEERRKSVRFACEVPVVIEQRFFALVRAVQRALG